MAAINGKKDRLIRKSILEDLKGEKQ